MEHLHVERILSYIEEHLKEELSLEQIAEEFHYSKYYLNRVFAEKTGITMYKYIQSRRLTEAARKLVETDQPIADIAHDSGYNSQQAFTLAFHQLYLYSPQNYRKKGEFMPKQPRMTIVHSCSRYPVYSSWKGAAAA